MSIKIELLEFIQCVLAKELAEHGKTIQPCLINKTGYYSAVYQSDPTLMHQQLSELIKQVLQVADEKIVLIVAAKSKHLELAIYADTNTDIAAICTTPEKAFFSQPVSIPHQFIELRSGSNKINAVLAPYIKFSLVNFTHLKMKSALSVDLIDEESKTTNDIDNNNDVIKLTLCNIVNAPDTDVSPTSTLFWPFYDTDIINMINKQASPEPLSILVADDSIPSQVATQAMLEKLGCKVVSANDGNSALALAQQQPFDLILLDERMPGLYGSDVAQRLVSDDAINRLTPKVALTGLTEPDEIQHLFSKGITHYLEKPVTKLALEKFLVQWQPQ
ncbi:response regulator [Shewanella sp. AC34-MNA-CIBAN-0136]|uniref:response regulator n=1 Tax=Shewanella sp. AC34-MNA-CIBAN-0136 TaxID=3140463 RepID=UPI00331C420D